MMKKFMAVMLAGAMAASMGTMAFADETEAADYVVNEAAAADPAVTLVMAEVNPLDTTVGMTDVKFKEAVEAMSGGSITIDLQDSGVLGDEATVLDTMLGGAGTIDISRISAFALSGYGCTKATLLSLPFVWQSRDHWWKFVHSDLAEEFLNEPQDNGLPLRGIYYGEEGFRDFFFKNEVAGLEDLKGMKIRVSNDPIMTGLVEAFGANPANVAFTELYSSLSSGVCDAAEQPVANYKSNSFQEVAPYLLLDEHTLGAIQVVVADTGWAKLTENQQQVLYDAGEIVEEYCEGLSAENEEKVLAELEDEGATVIEVEDKTPWMEAAMSAPAIQSAIEAQQDLYDQIEALAD